MAYKKEGLKQRFSGFKRFEHSDIVSENGKSVIHLPGMISPESVEKLISKFKLMKGTDENNTNCMAVIREVSGVKPAAKSVFPILSIKENEKTYLLLGYIYSDKVVSPDKKMALEIARALKLEYKEDA